MYVKRNIVARLRNHSYRRNARNVTYSVCVSVSLVTQRVQLKRHIVACGLSAAPYLSTLSHKRYDF